VRRASLLALHTLQGSTQPSPTGKGCEDQAIARIAWNLSPRRSRHFTGPPAKGHGPWRVAVPAVHGPQTNRALVLRSRCGSWLSWLRSSAVDPLALRRHLSVALPFRRARVELPTLSADCKVYVRSLSAYHRPLGWAIQPRYHLPGPGRLRPWTPGADRLRWSAGDGRIRPSPILCDNSPSRRPEESCARRSASSPTTLPPA